MANGSGWISPPRGHAGWWRHGDEDPDRPAGDFSLAVNADGLLLRATSEAVPGLAAATADVNRVRLGLEGSHETALGGGGRLTPSVEVD